MSDFQLQQKILKNASDQKLIKKALAFAEAAHQGQKRASGEDYFIHPLNVALILGEMRLYSPTIAAGLLHDVLDDTKKTVDDIEREFGKEISFLVQGVSKLGKLRYPKEELEIKSIEARVKNPIDLRAENLRKMFFAMGEDLRVVLIKLADRLHNIETLGALPPDKQQRIALETLEIFAPLADRLGIGELRMRLRDLPFPYL
jgi:GTP pyrophosphokinase